MTLSRTVIREKSSTFWKVRAMPRAMISSGGTVSSDCPSKVTCPDCGV